MTTKNHIDSVGWIFFGVTLAVMLAPCIYLILKMTNDSLSMGARAGTGITGAFFAAGFISWIVNSMLYYRARKREEREERERIESKKHSGDRKKKKKP